MFRHAIAAAALLLPTLAAAGFDEAIAAYSAGRYDDALKEFHQLAEQGDAQSLYFIGLFNHNGFGVKKDDAEAAKWFKRAAMKNNALAQYYMGSLTERGNGVDKDPVAAYMWYSLSVKNSANERDAAYTQKEVKRLEKKLTPEQVAKAKEMIAAFKPDNG